MLWGGPSSEPGARLLALLSLKFLNSEMQNSVGKREAMQKLDKS